MTTRMTEILRVLAQSHGPLTPNQIGHSLGFKDGGEASIPKHRTGGGCIRVMGPAQHVNFPLTRLRELGLVHLARRPDERSGMAYAITTAGREAAPGG